MKNQKNIRRFSMFLLIGFVMSLVSPVMAKPASQMSATEKIESAKSAIKYCYGIKEAIRSEMKSASTNNDLFALEGYRESYTGIKALLVIIENHWADLKSAIQENSAPDNVKAVKAYKKLIKASQQAKKYEIATGKVKSGSSINSSEGSGGEPVVIIPQGITSVDPTVAIFTPPLPSITRNIDPSTSF